MPLGLGLPAPHPSGLTHTVTTTDATTADLALSELHEHLAAIERLARAPFNADRIAMHRGLALECLDAIAIALAA